MGKGPRNLAIAVFGLGILIFILIAWGNIKLHEAGYVEIRIYHGNNYTTYWTRDYKEENGCVTFVDESHRSQKICGNYQIIK